MRSRDQWEQVEAAEDVEVDDWVADAVLSESIWTRGQLVGRRFTGLTAQDVRFVRCDFAGASLAEARLTRVRFESCRMTGASFAGATLQDVHVVDCAVDLADFRSASLRRSTLENSRLGEADFYGSTLVDVRLVDCQLDRANFDTAKATGLDLRGSTLDGGLGGPAALAGARIDAGQVVPLGAALVAAFGFDVDRSTGS